MWFRLVVLSAPWLLGAALDATSPSSISNFTTHEQIPFDWLLDNETLAAVDGLAWSAPAAPAWAFSVQPAHSNTLWQRMSMTADEGWVPMAGSVVVPFDAI